MAIGQSGHPGMNAVLLVEVALKSETETVQILYRNMVENHVTEIPQILNNVTKTYVQVRKK